MKTSKIKKIAVLMGGISAERAVSLRSGHAVTKALVDQGINAVACDVQSIDDIQKAVNQCDAAFIALHGRWGEDGQVQAILQSLGVPFTGCDMSSSAIAMDKLRTKWLWQGAHLPTPRFIRVSPHKPFDAAQFDLSFPVIVKPIQEGSSIGMRKAADLVSLASAVEFAKQYDSEVLIEQWVTGREFTCAILENKALPLIELKTSHDFYDYEAKYQSTDTQYICPVDLPEGLQQKMKALALSAFDVVGATGWARVDMMLDEQGEPWLIELNTVPGMTDHSLVPMAAKAGGLSFEQLVLAILKTAF